MQTNTKDVLYVKVYNTHSPYVMQRCAKLQIYCGKQTTCLMNKMALTFDSKTKNTKTHTAKIKLCSAKKK